MADLFNYYGAPDADRVMIAMGSVCDVADEVIDYLNAKGEKVGIVKVRLYRPWVSASLLKVLPKTASQSIPPPAYHCRKHWHPPLP